MSANSAPTIELLQEGSGTKSASFIVKPFSKSGIIASLSQIRSSCPDAQFDNVTNDMSGGNFESITREAMSSQNIIRIALGAGTTMFALVIVRFLLQR